MCSIVYTEHVVERRLVICGFSEAAEFPGPSCCRHWELGGDGWGNSECPRGMASNMILSVPINYDVNTARGPVNCEWRSAWVADMDMLNGVGCTCQLEFGN
jgi:hypothetical protein